MSIINAMENTQIKKANQDGPKVFFRAMLGE
jgi:hypothetical protein